MNDKAGEAAPERVEAEIGGVQGTGGEGGGGASRPAQSAEPGAPADRPAPDGAEIEWAGALVKKPPRPVGGA